MKGKYKAAFIIPAGVTKTLSEDGWEFAGDGYVSIEIKKHLIKELGLTLLESYLGIDAYVNDNMKMSVINDKRGHIESISFQLYGSSINTLLTVLHAGSIARDFELFVPETGVQG